MRTIMSLSSSQKFSPQAVRAHPALGGFERVQPGVKILKVEQGTSPDIANVTVEVSAAKGTFQRNGKEVPMETGVHDLRLYRNGQLVGQWPEAGQVTYKSLIPLRRKNSTPGRRQRRSRWTRMARPRRPSL